jgi:hypothetical protein
MCNFSSGVFGMLKSSLGLGLLMILLLIFGQIALFSSGIECEAMVVPMEDHQFRRLVSVSVV